MLTSYYVCVTDTAKQIRVYIRMLKDVCVPTVIMFACMHMLATDFWLVWPQEMERSRVP